MIKHSNGGHHILREVQEEFTRRYPYLKIESQAIPIPGLRRTASGPVFQGKSSDREASDDWLREELGISDTTTVEEVEDAITGLFGVAVQVFRRGGKFWIETRMTRNWSLKQQNDLGRDLSTGLR